MIPLTLTVWFSLPDFHPDSVLFFFRIRYALRLVNLHVSDLLWQISEYSFQRTVSFVNARIRHTRTLTFFEDAVDLSKCWWSLLIFFRVIGGCPPRSAPKATNTHIHTKTSTKWSLIKHKISQYLPISVAEFWGLAEWNDTVFRTALAGSGTVAENLGPRIRITEPASRT